jgi:hypothetical protein
MFSNQDLKIKTVNTFANLTPLTKKLCIYEISFYEFQYLGKTVLVIDYRSLYIIRFSKNVQI